MNVIDTTATPPAAPANAGTASAAGEAGAEGFTQMLAQLSAHETALSAETLSSAETLLVAMNEDATAAGGSAAPAGAAAPVNTAADLLALLALTAVAAQADAVRDAGKSGARSDAPSIPSGAIAGGAGHDDTPLDAEARLARAALRFLSHSTVLAPATESSPVDLERTAGLGPAPASATASAAADLAADSNTSALGAPASGGAHASSGADANSPARGAGDTAARMLHAHVGTPAWREELGAELAWLAEQGRQSASLKLSPEHLGPLEIRIAVRDGEASVYFGATQADTRTALEQALPRLRELLASQGLVLADAGVFREAPRDAPDARPAPHASGAPAGAEAADESSAASIVRVGLVDVYA
jgi:flagellar hook-length control protein FliK